MGWRSSIRLAFCAAMLALSHPPAPAAAEGPDRLAEALALPVASGLIGARDTPLFAWVDNAAGVRNIWVGSEGRTARRVTAFEEDDGQQIYDLALRPDGASLAFVRGGDEEYPDDDEDLPNPGAEAAAPRQQVFLSELKGGPATLIGEGHLPVFAPHGERLAFTRRGDIWLWDRTGGARRLTTVAGEVTRLEWSTDGKRLLFVDNRGDHSFIALLDIAEARLRYIDPGLGFSVEPAFSPDGRHIAFIRYVAPPARNVPDEGAYWSIRVAEAAGGASREVWAAPAGIGGRYAGTRSRNLFWSTDGQIVFPWERSGWLHVYAVDAAKGGPPRPLTSGAFEVETFLLDRGGRALIYAANAGNLDLRHVWRRPLDGAAAARVSQDSGIESVPALGDDSLAVIATDAARPAYPALVGRKLSPLRPARAAQGFAAPEEVVFRAEDGLELRGQLFRARGKGKRPAIVYIHGGPRRQMLLGFHPSPYYSKTYVLNQHLAARGYHVLSVNYRSGTGYGLAFRDAPETGREGASEYRDVLAAGRWLAARPDVDPDRVGVWGGSWGGYLAALGLARDSALFAAGVDMHGVHSLLRPVPDTLSPDAQLAARRLQWQSSPMASLDRWRSPVLLIHGDDDRNVPFSQSLLLARELAARRIPYRELAFPNERHSFFRHANWLAAFRAATDFFDQTLMRKEPLP